VVSWVSALAKYVLGVVLPPIADAVAERLAERTAKPDPNRAPPVFGRLHAWDAYFPKSTVKRPFAVCLQCGRERTDATEYSPCPGPPPKDWMR
jgi:hypothetical protein